MIDARMDGCNRNFLTGFEMISVQRPLEKEKEKSVPLTARRAATKGTGSSVKLPL